MYQAIPFYNLPRTHHKMEKYEVLTSAEVCNVRAALRLVFTDRRRDADRAQGRMSDWVPRNQLKNSGGFDKEVLARCEAEFPVSH